MVSVRKGQLGKIPQKDSEAEQNREEDKWRALLIFNNTDCAGYE